MVIWRTDTLEKKSHSKTFCKYPLKRKKLDYINWDQNRVTFLSFCFDEL